VRFTNGYVCAAMCSPSRAGLLTGIHPQRFGHENNDSVQGANRGMDVRVKTLGDHLRAAGYATGWVGKWHLGEAPKFRPEKRGFDETFGFLWGMRSYFPLPENSRQTKDRRLYRNGMLAPEEDEYLTSVWAREACAFIERHTDQPWFLYLAFNAPHTPMDAESDTLARLGHIADPVRRRYAAMMSAMDTAIGRVLDLLASKGLDERTLIFFLSDNGGPATRDPQDASFNRANNEPLRGGKWDTYEGGIRVPFCVRWKGTLPANRVFDSPVVSLDIAATALAAARAKPVDGAQLDGVNLLPFLTGERGDAPHDALYWRNNELWAIREGDWALVRMREAESHPDYKKPLPALLAPRLFHLANDVGENTDVAPQHPELVGRLRAKWEAWNATLPPPPGANR
jgi:arylsulfatase A-like enzyme